MPRLSNSDYWKHHKTLRYLWLKNDWVYAELSYARQMQLHNFFKPSEDWAKEKLVAYRKQITAECPNLPHQAAWALKEIERAVQTPARVRSPAKRGRLKKVVVKGVARPGPNYDFLAHAHVKMALQRMGMSDERIEELMRQVALHKAKQWRAGEDKDANTKTN